MVLVAGCTGPTVSSEQGAPEVTHGAMILGASNLALGRPARQSSDNFGTTGGEAVDGNRDGTLNSGSVTHTHPQPEPPWWQVDLGAEMYISRIELYNRTDCCGERLRNFDVLLSNDGATWTPVFFQSSAVGASLAIPLAGAQGRFVRVQLRNADYLSLAEVEVYGRPVGRQLAIGRPAMQSSNNFGTTGAEAVDGDTDGNLANGSVTHTHPDGQAWWQVDLEQLARLYTVRIHNRTDCCGERLSGFDLMTSLDGVSWTSVYYSAGTAGASLEIPLSGAEARYVRVQLRGQDYLSLAEVEVLGEPVGTNKALGRPASQSSNNFGTTGMEAVDGDRDGELNHGSVTHTHPQPEPEWWQVELDGRHQINEVRLWNRTDCCGERLRDFFVEISNDGATWSPVFVPGLAGPQKTVILHGAVGRFVRVRLKNVDYLSLAEVEVMASPMPRAMVLLDDRLYGPARTNLDRYVGAVRAARKLDLDLRVVRGIDDWAPAAVKSYVKTSVAENTALEGVLMVGNIRIPTLCFNYGVVRRRGLVASFYDNLDATYQINNPPADCAALGTFDYNEYVEGSHVGAEIWVSFMPVGFADAAQNTYPGYAAQIAPLLRKAIRVHVGRTRAERKMYEVSNDIRQTLAPLWEHYGPANMDVYSMNPDPKGTVPPGTAAGAYCLRNGRTVAQCYTRIPMESYASYADFWSDYQAHEWMGEDWQNAGVYLGHLANRSYEFVYVNLHSHETWSLIGSDQARALVGGGTVMLGKGCSVGKFSQPHPESGVSGAYPNENILLNYLYGSSRFIAATGTTFVRQWDAPYEDVMHTVKDGAYLGQSYLLARQQADPAKHMTWLEILLGDPFVSFDAPATASPLSGNLQVNSNWHDGYCTQLTVTNTGTTTINGWEVTVDMGQSWPYTAWGASYWSLGGGRYRLTSMTWNSTVTPGTTIYLGFCSWKTGTSSTPILQSVRAM